MAELEVRPLREAEMDEVLPLSDGYQTLYAVAVVKSAL